MVRDVQFSLKPMRFRFRVACIRIVAVVSLMSGLADSALAGHYSWTTAGPESGTIRQILVDSQNPSRLLAAAGYYGPYLFETANRGASWSFQEGLVGFGRIVPDPVHAEILYSGGFGAVWKTIDGGRTWISSSAGLSPSAAISAVAVAPSAPDTLYAVTQTNPTQVYRSLDAGEAWTLVSNTLSSYYVGDLACDPFDPSILYAAADTDVFKSVDGGATFAPTGLGHYVRHIVIDARPPGILYAATGDAGIFKSTDAGATWNPANAGMENHVMWDLALDPADPLRLFAASSGGSGSPGGLFVTADGGGTWSPVDLGIPVNVATAVTSDPTDASRVYVGAGTSILKGSVFVSADGGSSWVLSNRGLSGYFSYAVAGHPAQGGAAYGVSGSRVYRTDDSGADWTLRGDTGFGLTSLILDPSGADTLYGGFVSPTGSGDGVLKSGDGGVTWNPASNGLAVSGLHRLAISPSAPDHLLAASLDGLFSTLDGGGLWSPLLAGDVHAAAIDPADASILYAGLYSSLPTDNGILRSPDGGTTWSPPAGIPSSYPHVNDIAAPANDPLRVYAAAYSGVFRSVDRGLNFSPANMGLPPMPGIVPFRLAPDPADAGTVYLLAALGSNAAPAAPDAVFPFNVFRTANGADSWTPLPGFLPVLGSLDFTVSATGRTLYAATTSGVFQFERSFVDVPETDPFWPSVDAAAMNGVTSGCGSGNFCPDLPTSRATIAVFLLRGKNGVGYAPPPATGTVFGDVSASAFAAGFIEELSVQGISAGCGGGNYCPDAALTRAQVAVLLLKTKHGSDFVPPPATGMVFTDVPAGAFAADWIEQLALEGVTAGCGGGNFCPDAPVSRAQAAVFVALAFGLS